MTALVLLRLVELLFTLAQVHASVALADRPCVCAIVAKMVLMGVAKALSSATVLYARVAGIDGARAGSVGRQDPKSIHPRFALVNHQGFVLCTSMTMSSMQWWWRRLLPQKLKRLKLEQLLLPPLWLLPMATIVSHSRK